MPATPNLGNNLAAFLDMIAVSEIGPKLLELSDDGYDVLVGSTPAKPLLFHDYSAHPRIRNKAMNSDAAGRYQFMGRYWAHYQKQLKLPDFGPRAQDKWAIQLIKECKAVGLIDKGDFPAAVHACRSRWASFPSAGYGQPEHKIETLLAAYTQAGGTVA